MQYSHLRRWTRQFVSLATVLDGKVGGFSNYTHVSKLVFIMCEVQRVIVLQAQHCVPNTSGICAGLNRCTLETFLQ